jgi:hypothetical protein
MTASSLNDPRDVFVRGNKLYVGDSANNRVLIFDNVTDNPSLSLSNSSEARDQGLIRKNGLASLPPTSPYIISSVQFWINGSGPNQSTATDGGFDSAQEEYYFDFDPKTNQPKDSLGNLIDGYTVNVKSINSNLDATDNRFYFSPFDVNDPSDNAIIKTTSPTFDFSVNRQRANLRDHLSKYQILVRSGKEGSVSDWKVLIDDIPVDKDNGIYETDKLYATYSDDSSRIKVYSKNTPLYGTTCGRSLPSTNQVELRKLELDQFESHRPKYLCHI